MYIPDSNQGTTNALMAMIPSLCQQKGLDPASVMAMCKDRNGAWSDLIALVIVAAIFGFGNGGIGGGLFGGRGGFGGGFVPNMINNDQNTQMLMQAIQRNGTDVNTLAAAAGASRDAIIAAINGVSKEICNFGINSGQNFNQVLTAIMQGNNGISTQIANCCCTLRDSITQQGYQSQLGQKDIQNSMLTGFGQIGNIMATDTCAIKQNATDNTGRILAKLDQIEDSRKDREISALQAQLTAANSRAERAAELAPINKALADIQCKQPSTATVTYPNLVGVPASMLYGGAIAAAAAGAAGVFGVGGNGGGIFG